MPEKGEGDSLRARALSSRGRRQAAPIARNVNNPYHRAAWLYDLGLSLPVISLIRRQEVEAVFALLTSHAHLSGRVLEIGPGSGFYTLRLASMFGEVVAVEDSPAMAEILRHKLRSAQVSNVTLWEGDFLSLAVAGSFDVAVAVGVLDYVADPAAFVEKMCACARRAAIFTVPHRGLWGGLFATANRLRRTKVYCYDESAPERWAPGWRCTRREIGLKTPFTRGLTLAVVLER